MIVRVRSRDGLERVTVSAGVSATIAELKSLIESQIGVPIANQILSLDQNLLLPKALDRAAVLSQPEATLISLGIGHGSVVFLLYDGERSVNRPRGAAAVTPAGSFGRKMTMDDLIARQVRITRQEAPHCDAVSFDRGAADQFQRYVNETLAFSVKRGGFMYGRVTGEEKKVEVEFIYEPPQQGTVENLYLLRDPEEEALVEAIAAGLGVIRVGFIFTQAVGAKELVEGEYTVSARELLQAVELHAESGIEEWVTAIVKMEVNEEGGADVHFEAFQLSDICVRLFKEGLFVAEIEDESDPKLSKMKKDVIVGGKDTRDVDNDFFLVLVKISDHQGLLSSSFPVENRITTVTTRALRSHLDRAKGQAFVKRISDFHLLLMLARYLDANSDVPALTECVRMQTQVPEGYQLLIESLASTS
ncbi:NPL4-like protein 2 [Wolffia australiana]